MKAFDYNKGTKFNSLIIFPPYHKQIPSEREFRGDLLMICLLFA